MISYLEGKLLIKKEKFIILNVRGVGYKIFMSQRVLSKITQKDKDLKIFCHQNVRETALDLYGFLNQSELEFFETLIDIRTIGPKAALEIASIAPMEKVKEAIESEDEEIVRELFNIGKKKAQILILELSKKIKKAPKENTDDDAFQALLNLGFPRKKVKAALKKVSKDVQGSEKRVKEALKILGK
ncbi:Holliday junction branch migration protein RuvA [Patescibacteria group bacterium]